MLRCRIVSLPLAALTLIVVGRLNAGCSGSDATKPEPAGPPAAAVIVRGNAQVDTVAQQLSDTLILSVTDGRNAPVPNAVILWVGDGTVFVAASATNAFGQGRNLWTLGTKSGDQHLEVRWADPTTGEMKLLATFTATALPGKAASVRVTRSAVGFIGERMALTNIFDLHDEYGNPVQSVPRVVSSSDPRIHVAGDTVWADVELSGTLNVTLDGTPTSLPFASLYDFRKTRWAVDHSCAHDTLYLPATEPDTMRLTAVTDSVTYNTLPGTVGSNGVLYLHMRGTQYQRAHAGTETTLPVTFTVYVSQFVGSIETAMMGGNNFGPPLPRLGLSDGAVPPTYTGGRWCDNRFERYTPIVLKPMS